jgi:linoleoyl-CoA desaturase
MFIVAPILFLSIAWWQVLIGFVVMHLAEGLVLGLVFQLAHVVEQTEFPEPDNEGQINDSWAVFQMKTTADFARSNKLVNFLCGGLNFQVEHHLFPLICHIHYPEVSKIVKKTAAEFDVPFYENKTFLGALKSHYTCLKRFGMEKN